MRLVHVIALAVAGGLSTLPAVPQTMPTTRAVEHAQRAGSSKYVGPEVCQGCHDEQYKSFSTSAHALATKNEEEDGQGCEGCHGPGAAHVEDGGDPEKIRRAPRSHSTALQPLPRS
jgi:hypothetical protein